MKALQMLKNKEISSGELTKEFCRNINELNPKLNAFITFDEESALNQAKIADENIAKGNFEKLTGIPVAIKDVFCTKGVKTTAASKMLENFIPNYTADVVQKVEDSGAIMIGKTNMDEFAMGSLTVNSYYGSTISNIKSKSNPDYNLTPGGSSGGSCVAVSANLAMAAMGSDTGGSVRQPASFCGVVGAKPTYGMCSRYGIISYASSFDSPGFFAKNIEDTAYLMEIIAGYTQNDSVLYKQEKYDFTSKINNGIKGMKIAILDEFAGKAPDFIMEKVKLSEEILTQQGASISHIKIPHIEKSINVYYIITPSEMSANLAKFDGIRYGNFVDSEYANIDEYYTKIRSENFGNEVKRRIMIGNYILSSAHYGEFYEKALKIRRLIKNEFDEVFEKYDAILCPTTLNVAFDPVKQQQDSITTYMNDISTAPINIVGLPAISIPCGTNDDNLPIGMQIICNRLQDNKMYQIAKSLESGIGNE